MINKIRQSDTYLIKAIFLVVGMLLPTLTMAFQPAGLGQNYAAPMQNQPMAGMGTYQVVAAPQNNSMILGGTVVAVREVTLTAQLAGRIEFLGGKEGDWFTKQSLIVGLSGDALEAQRRNAVAQLGAAESIFRNSRVQYSKELWAPKSRDIGRMPGMGMPSMFDQFFTRGMGSSMGMGNPWLERQADLYGQNSQVQKAQSQMLQAHSGIDVIEAKLRDTRTLAPFSGVLTKKFIEVGDTVQPGEPLVSIADVSQLQIQVEVPVRIVGALQVGMTIPARLDVGGQVQVHVAQIYPAAHANRHTVTVKFDLPQGTRAGPGLYAEVMLPDGNSVGQLTPIIPFMAATRRGSLPAVFVFNSENKTQLRLVRLGEPMGNGFIPVLSGLKVGEIILAAPQPGYRAGQPLQGIR